MESDLTHGKASDETLSPANIKFGDRYCGTESEVPVPNAKVPAAPKLRDSAKFSVLESIWNIRTHEQLLSKLTVLESTILP